MDSHEKSATMRALATPGLLGPDGVPGLFCHLEELFGQIGRAGRAAVGPIKGYASLIQDGNEYDSNEAWWSRKIERNANQFDAYLRHLEKYRLEDAVGVVESTFEDILHDVMPACSAGVAAALKIEVVNVASRPFAQHCGLLSRVMYHVVRNAVESAQSRVSVRIGEKTVADGHRIGREFNVSVTDDGPGVENRNKKLIWEPFFTTRRDHLGLGLPYVTAVAALVDISFDLASRGGRGTTMTLVFRDKGE